MIDPVLLAVVAVVLLMVAAVAVVLKGSRDDSGVATIKYEDGKSANDIFWVPASKPLSDGTSGCVSRGYLASCGISDPDQALKEKRIERYDPAKFSHQM